MKILIDNDAALDDAMAFMYLASCPEIDIVGITIAGTGEAHGPAGAKNMARLCKMFGLDDMPIAYGFPETCSGAGKPFPDWLRTSTDKLLDKLDAPEHPDPNISDAPLALIKECVEDNEELTIIATGPLTNIAKFIQTYPDQAHKISKIVIMGGAVKVPGNIKALDASANNDVAEWNIYADPSAADIVFKSGVPIMLVPLDATNHVLVTREFIARLSLQTHPTLHLCYQLMKSLKDEVGDDMFFKEVYLWDTLAAMFCAQPELAMSNYMPLLMDVEKAQTRLVDQATEGATLIKVATGISVTPQEIFEKLFKVLYEHRQDQLSEIGPDSSPRHLRFYDQSAAKKEQQVQADSSDMIKLKNGTEVPKILAYIICKAIEAMWNGDEFMHCYSLAMHCRDPKNKLSDNTQKKLRQKALIVNDEIPEEVKNIMLCAFEGDGLDMAICSPFLKSASASPKR